MFIIIPVHRSCGRGGTLIAGGVKIYEGIDHAMKSRTMDNDSYTIKGSSNADRADSNSDSKGESEAIAYAEAAIAARDAELARISELSNNQKSKYVTVAAGYNKNTGQVAVGAKIEEEGMRTYCVEDMIVVQLIALGANLEDIVMTPAIRPRTMEVIPVCKFCQLKYNRDNFIPGTPFE